ncbi:hypothetical protein GJ744_001026 [Endocarpon pusillum]|uniref:Uncharacterized protein n=1 Tax=Endocarpon pusillum TaxID=364733 RepID=A0A8H7AA40_9EURO|nr:hypothetical protein GJ744_001026 [Endocarpon pusillum]
MRISLSVTAPASRILPPSSTWQVKHCQTIRPFAYDNVRGDSKYSCRVQHRCWIGQTSVSSFQVDGRSDTLSPWQGDTRPPLLGTVQGSRQWSNLNVRFEKIPVSTEGESAAMRVKVAPLYTFRIREHSRRQSSSESCWMQSASSRDTVYQDSGL